MPTGNEDHSISLTTASQYTKNYRDAHPSTGLVLGFAIGKKIYHDIINQEGCVFIRTYKAINEDGEEEIVVVGVDINGDDMTSGIIADRSFRNPPFSGVSGPLNS